MNNSGKFRSSSLLTIDSNSFATNSVTADYFKRITVEYVNVSFSYPSRPDVLVLNDVSLHVECNQMIAFVGPSGSGKTTLLELLMRSYVPTFGKIFLNGCSITEYSKNLILQQIAYVPQEVILFSDTILWNLCLGNTNVPLDEVVSACRAANAHEFISKMPNVN